jgi:hypothetical protein
MTQRPALAVPLPGLRRWALTVAPGVLALAIAHAGSVALHALPTLDAAASGETLFLARLALIVQLLLLAPAALLRGSALAAWCVATVGTAALLWALPAGPTRGLAVSSLLVLALVVTLARLGRASFGPAGQEAPSTPLGAVLPAALALQCLALPAAFLAHPLDARSLVRLLVLPAIGCLLGGLLARRRGLLLAAVAVAAPLAISGRFTVAVLVAIAIPSVAALLFDRDRPGAARGAALLALLLPFALDPVLGVMALLGALAFGGRRAWPAALVVATGMLALLPPERSWGEATTLLLLLVLVVPLPAARWLAALLRGRRPQAVRLAWELAVPLLLGWIALRFAQPPAALAVPAVLLALGLESPAEDAADAAGTRRALAGWQLGWCGLWLAGSLLAGSYPWLRAPGAATLAGLLGLDRAPWLAAAGIIAAILALALVRSPAAPAPGAAARSPRWLLAACAAAVLALSPAAHGPGRALLGWPAVELSGDLASWSSTAVSWPGGPAAVVVDSAVAYGAGVPTGTALANVRWVAEPGAIDAAPEPVTLRLGIDSAEWSAAPPERPGVDAWLSQIGPDGHALVHRYRARRALGALPAGEGRLVVERSADLPEAVRLSLYRVRLLAGGGERAAAP